MPLRILDEVSANMNHDSLIVNQISAILHIHDQFLMIVVVLIFTSN